MPWGVAAMAGMIRKSLDTPQETRISEAGMGKLELISTEAGPAGRATFQPGRQWSRHVKPVAQTESCQAPHTGYFMSGRMKVRMDDRQETGFGPGDFSVIPPSHDAWVIADQPGVVIDWQGFADYAGPARLGLRRIANTRTSNELTDTPPSESARTSAPSPITGRVPVLRGCRLLPYNPGHSLRPRQTGRGPATVGASTSHLR